MRKSKAIRLMLLGSTGFALAACDDRPPADARFYRTAEDCVAVHDKATCDQMVADGRAAYAKEAPRYTRKEECEAEFGAGNCEARTADASQAQQAPQEGAQASSGGSIFMPLLMGYMLGNAFNRPVYRGPDNSAVMRSGGSFYNVGKFAGVGRAAAFQPAPITKVARGGFGRTASYRSGAGG